MGFGSYGPWAKAHMGLGPLPLTVRLTVPNCFTAYPRGNYKHVWTDSTQTLADATFPETHCLEPTGPRPIWAKAHMGQGPYGPGPIWARGHMGPGPLGPGPFLVGRTPHQKTHPGKKSPNCVFFVVFWKQKRCATSVRSFWRRYRAEISAMCQKMKVFVL